MQVEIDKALAAYMNGLAERGHFDTVQVAPENSSEVPDEPGGVRAVILGVVHPHNGRDGSKAMGEINDIYLQRGNSPRVYRNTLVFITAEERQLENLELAMRSSLAWSEVVRDAESGRLNLRTSDISLAKSKAKEGSETTQARLKEAWSYVVYPYQDSPQSDVAFTTTKVAAQDGILKRASKKLVSDGALLPEIGPDNLNRNLTKYIWNEKNHLLLRDIWEYLNRYTYLPRLKDRDTLIKAVQSAVGETVPGPFAYAERFDEAQSKYHGLVIEASSMAAVIIDSESVLVDPKVAETNRPDPATPPAPGPTPSGPGPGTTPPGPPPIPPENYPTRFQGTVFLSSDRPARDMNQIVESVIEQLTTLPGVDVTIKLEIDAEVPSGLDRAKVRTLMENASTLNFTDKSVK